MPQPTRAQLPGWNLRTREILLATLASLPFLVPIHLPPVPSFHTEWLAGLLGLVLICLSVATQRGQRLTLPSIWKLPALFGLATLGHQLMGSSSFQQQALLYVAYLLLALCLMVSGADQLAALGRKRFTTALAAGFAVGALLQCFIAIMQAQRLGLGGFVAPLLRGYGIYGNLGQQNHLTHYVWLGLLSLLYLYTSKRVAIPSFLVAATLLAILSAYTGSRSALLYPLVCGGLALIMKRRAQAMPAAKDLRNGLFIICTLALTAQYVPTHLPPPVGVSQSSGMERLVTATVESNRSSVRWDLLRASFSSTLQRPLTGHGPGSVPWQSLVNARGDQAAPYGVAEHFHNAVANWAVEFGLPVTLCALALLIAWCRRILVSVPTPESLWSIGILVIAGVHSLLEYPLWYAFFLAPAALLLGAFDPAQRVIALSTFTRRSLGPALLLATILLGMLWSDHARLSRIYLLPPRGPEAAAIWRAQVDELLELHRNSLFSPMINGMLIVTADIDRHALANKQHVCAAALRYSPAPAILFKCAALAALAGQTAHANELARLGQRAFPQQAAEASAEWAALTARFPELQPLASALGQSPPATAVSDR